MEKTRGDTKILTLELGRMVSQQRRKLGNLVGNRESCLGQKNELVSRGQESEIRTAIAEVVRERALTIW